MITAQVYSNRPESVFKKIKALCRRGLISDDSTIGPRKYQNSVGRSEQVSVPAPDAAPVQVSVYQAVVR